MDYKCIKCASLEQNSCTECDIGYELNNSLCVVCNSTSYYDASSLKCIACEGLCYSCNSSTICTSCIENSYMIYDTECTCRLGYSEINTCERNFFTVAISINGENNVTLLFSESLNSSLTKSSIITTVDNEKLDFTIDKLSPNKYIITVDFVSDITNSTILQIAFITDIISIDNSLLLNTSITTKLFINNTALQNKHIAAQAATAKSTAQSGTTAGFSVAVIFSLLSFNPTSFFNFINTAEMLSVVLLFNANLYPVLSNFLLGTKAPAIIPNAFSYFIDENQGVTLSQPAINYGNPTNLLLLNDGNQIIIFIAFLLILFILLLMTFKPQFKTKLQRPIKYFKYGFFLRFLIQNYLSSLISTLQGIRFSHLDNSIQIIDYCFCIIFLVNFI